MDPSAALAAYDAQIRRKPDSTGRVTQVAPDGEGWRGVTWSALDETSADAVIAEQIRLFAGRPWEWKHYSHDQPADLAARLVRAGFVAEPAETLMAAEIAGLDLAVPAPAGIELRDVTGEDSVALLVQVHDEVFGGDHRVIGDEILGGLAQQPPCLTATVALDGATPVSAGRVEFHDGTEFASIWGGGTLPAYRGRGIFRALVSHRAAQAAARGFRYLQVDASAESRPILRRLGFAELATTTPYVYPG